LGIYTGHFSEHRHSILPFTTIKIQNIKRIKVPNGNYDEDNDCGYYDDCSNYWDDGCVEYDKGNAAFTAISNTAIATVSVKNDHESGFSDIYTWGSAIRRN
jgi:hypothetical protein